MPELSRFYGIIIKMYFQKSEHNPPHIHVEYNENVAELNINDGSLIAGNLPLKALALVREWVLLHNEELINIWNTQDFKKIEPLE